MNYLKLTLSKFVLIVLIVTGFTSCDKVKKPYMVEKNFLECDTPSFPALDNLIRKYLLEDYTGHTCTNCPKAHDIIVNDLSSLRDTLIVIAIHAGSYAEPKGEPFSADYRTEAGKEYDTKFNIPQAYPHGTINRMFFGNNRTLSANKWKSTFDTITRKPPAVAIQVLTEFNNDIACVFVKTSLLNNISENLRLCVLLTENNIVSPQQNGSKIDTNYVHNHVLRHSLAPIWGDNVELSVKDESVVKGYSIDFNGKIWKKENCYIIAFVYNLDTYEILQVEEVKLVQ